LRLEVELLRKENDRLRRKTVEDAEKIGDLQKEIADRDKKIADLEHQLAGRKKDSTNSSKPPSSDGPGAPKRIHPQRERSGRKPGGQKGHPGRHRPLAPIEQVSQFVAVLPDSCNHCGHAFPKDRKKLRTVGDVQRHQVTELPEITPEITEYQFPEVVCPKCEQTTRAPIPAAIRGHFGPKLAALSSYLTVVCRTPRRKVEELLGNVLGISISLGSAQKLIEETSAALEAPYQELENQLRHEPVLNSDETGWSKGGEKRWLWGLVASTFVFFVVAKTRSSEVLRRLLGAEFRGILCSDRFAAYIKYHANGIAQFCWAHLKRDLLGIKELGRTTDADRFARNALALHARLFRLWHCFRAGKIDRAELNQRSIPLEKQFFALGERYLDSDDAEVRALAAAFFWHCDRLFTFIAHPGVEPTNNVSERALRTAVQWRKICFGNRSEGGEKATARLLTAAGTCTMQKRNLLDFLAEAIRCYRSGLPAPSLLPQKA
jgi:transposase